MGLIEYAEFKPKPVILNFLRNGGAIYAVS